jgi:hypothetical protein
VTPAVRQLVRGASTVQNNVAKSGTSNNINPTPCLRVWRPSSAAEGRGDVHHDLLVGRSDHVPARGGGAAFRHCWKGGAGRGVVDERARSVVDCRFVT